MAAPYSLDLRRKVMPACQSSGQSQQTVAGLFGVSLSFVEGLMRRVRHNAELAPRKWRPGPPRKIAALDCQRLER